jgi:hypothetical protein
MTTATTDDRQTQADALRAARADWYRDLLRAHDDLLNKDNWNRPHPGYGAACERAARLTEEMRRAGVVTATQIAELRHELSIPDRGE